MSERGPDHEGFAIGDGFAIGHRRLSIIDVHPEANQPFWDASRRHVLTYNGEIYNYRELRTRLERKGVNFATSSDTEVLLAAILTLGLDEALAAVRGMFAFVLHDIARQETIAVRDHFGQKPLYYAQPNGEFVAASDPLAVTDITGIYEPDEGASGVYLMTSGETGTRGVHMPERSFFAGVQVLPAGHYVKVTGEGSKKTRYFAPWHLVDDGRLERASRRSEADLEAELGELIDQAVRRHLVSDVPTGMLLSGGIDSSSAFWYAAAQNPELQTFTKVSPGIEQIPLDVVPQLLRMQPVTAHFVRQHRSRFVSELEEFVAYSRTPSRWNSGPSMNSLCRTARDNGVIVLLGGDAVDEYFGGYIHYRGYFENGSPDEHDLGELIRLTEVGNGVARAASEQYTHAQEEIRQEILDRLGFVNDPAERHQHATLLHDTATFLQTCTLPHSDAYSMMTSVELRNPMLDLDLVAFAVNLPISLRAATCDNGQYGKRLFRQLARRQIGEFVDIPKEGTRNYAMAMADPDLWRLDSFRIAESFALPSAFSKRDLIRIINLELFYNAFFAGNQRRSLDEMLTRKGRALFDCGGKPAA